MTMSDIDYEVWSGDEDSPEWCASASNLQEARRYQFMYSQDEPAWVVKCTRERLPDDYE